MYGGQSLNIWTRTSHKTTSSYTYTYTCSNPLLASYRCPTLPWAVPGCATTLYSIAFSVLPSRSTQTCTCPISSDTTWTFCAIADDNLNDRATSSSSMMRTVARWMWMLTPGWFTSIVTIRDSWSSSRLSLRRIRLWHTLCSLMAASGWNWKDSEKLL